MSLGTALATSLGLLFAPLQLALRDRVWMRQLLDDLGWTVEVLAEDVEAIGALLPVAGRIEELAAAIEAYETESVEAGALVEDAALLAEAVFDAIQALSSLSGGGLSGLTAPLDDPATWAELALDLPEYLVLHWLSNHHPIAYAVLLLGGVISETERGGDRPPRAELDWDALQSFLDAPAEHVAATYGWDADFAHALLLERLARLGRAAGLRPRRSPVRQTLQTDYFGGAAPADVRELRAPLHEGWSKDASAYFRAGLLTLPVPRSGTGAPDGLLLTSEILGEATGEIALDDTWTLALSAGADLSGALGVTFHPGVVALAATSEAAVGLSLSLRGAPAIPWVLLGDDDGTRLELGGFEAEVAIDGSTGSPELILSADASEALRLVIDPAEGDSFLGDVLGSEPLVVTGGLSARWSSATGFTFGGALGFEVVIPLDLDVGPVFVDWMRVGISLGTDGLSAELAVTGGLDVGPFAAVVDDIGLRANVSRRERGAATGTFGAFDVTLAFKPPLGLGLSIGGGVAQGGGYLYLDPEAGEYGGILDLQMVGVGITATGLLATKLPGGAPGWSLFFSLAARFTGVQLGFGFTLNGVGGLIGINRGLDESALADGIRTGALEGILFPDDPVASAPQILADIDAIFPVAVGQYVFGPIAKLGWGTPTLVELDLGVVFQLPEPLTVSMLGSLEALLPTKDAALLELRVDVAGTLNLTEGTLKIDASLRDSRVLTLELTGDMAVRMSFFDAPAFLVSFGGFHPEFTPPADFPELQRLGVALDTGDSLRISLGSYFALTSNTVQFGAEYSLYAKALGFSAEGGASFDALIELAPFGFVVDLKVWVSIQAGSVELLGVLLAGELRGPNPWHAAGEATFKILGIKKSLKVEATFGAKQAEPPKEIVNLTDRLVEELGIGTAWTALPPDGDGDSGVVLSDADASTLEVHPAGRIEVRQRLVPLGIRIDHYGEADLAGTDMFTLDSPRIGAVAVDAPETVEDWFAAAQYWELKEDEKLSSPSFEVMAAGLRLGDDGFSAGPASPFTYDYEVVYRDPNTRAAGRERPGTVVGASQIHLDRARARGASLAARSRAGLPRSTRQTGTFAVKSPTFVVASTQTAEVALTPREGVSFYSAREALRSASDGISRGGIPAYELETWQ